MSRRKRNRPGQDDARSPSKSAESGSAFAGSSEAERLSAEGWKDRKKPTRRSFPGPRGVDVPLRVACERAAYAEVVAHAKESLDTEICGVLVGTECVDDDGVFVHAQAAVRGAKAQEGATHVTFTQDTWNTIHETIERDYPKLQIVGWYHSHPGFGVEFSDMDIFIQNNFFPGQLQVALVTDPLGGEVAICVNQGEGVQYLPRFWVDAREQRCFTPARADSGSAMASGGAAAETIASLETRISQLIDTVDDLRRTFYRWVTTLGMLLGLAIMFFIASQVSTMVFGRRPELPRKYSFAPVPVEIDGKACLLGVDIVSWKIPDELIPIVRTKESDDDASQDEDEPSTDGSMDPSPAVDPAASDASKN